VLRLVELQVFHAREEDSRLADDGAAGLQHHVEAAAGEARGEALAVGANVGRALLGAVLDAEAAAQVQVLERDPRGLERGHQLEDLFQRFLERRGIQSCEPMWQPMPTTRRCFKEAAWR
jgi:hypothetical protein